MAPRTVDLAAPTSPPPRARLLAAGFGLQTSPGPPPLCTSPCMSAAMRANQAKCELKMEGREDGWRCLAI
uniref:Uncharacterized protein n=1 Tax=Arundo donax TaxID=35708 RepID=A0A0A9TKF2_ARUDO